MILLDLPREAVCRPSFWRFSPSVPVLEKPPRASAPPADDTPWRLALEAIPNKGAEELGYDEWFRVIAAIYTETAGSPEGLAIAQAWSARAGKHDPEFLESRVWPYLDDDRAGRVTGRTIMSIASRLTGWAKPLDAEGFTAVDERGRPVDDDAGAGADDDDEDLTGVGLRYTPGGAIVRRVSMAQDLEDAIEETRRGVPPAQHACTDQANANRLIREFGGLLLVAAGAWYCWNGRYWERGEAELYRMACQLGRLIKIEAKAAHTQVALLAPTDPAGAAAAAKVAKALDGWSAHSEMRGGIEAAIGLLKKMLAVDPATLDRSPWLMTVANGTVDLRTKTLRPFRREDRITRIADVKYRPGARSLAWERVVREACCGDESLAAFLQRWWGYCATGSTREQKFAVLWGTGGNAKSLLVGTVARILGSYAGTAAGGLMVGGKGSQVHSSAVVALVGKRLVTAHESGEGGMLAEDFIKKATGEDKLDARYLFGEQFEFVPTHKLQLLTNHKPTIRGSDRGIWRRVVMVPFQASFGSPEDVAEGRARQLADPLLGEFLKREEEQEGILAWVFDGAAQWYTQGLREPAVVREAVADYQSEQDRVGQFVTECCELGAEHEAPLSDAGMRTGLYPAFVQWCKDSGVHAVSKRRFVDEVARVVPGSSVRRGRLSVSEGRGKVVRLAGLRLVEDDEG